MTGDNAPWLPLRMSGGRVPGGSADTAVKYDNALTATSYDKGLGTQGPLC